MERSEWMYQTLRLSPGYIGCMKKFVDTAQKHSLTVKQQEIICPCSHSKNKLAHEGGVVQSHRIRFGFIQEYTVWRFHGKADASGSAS
jgi:hypothetical protein